MNRSLCLAITFIAAVGTSTAVNAGTGTSGCSSSTSAASAAGSSSGFGGSTAASTTTTTSGSESFFFVPETTSCGPGGGGTLAAPELDPTSSIAALTLAAGSIAIMVGRRVRRTKIDQS